MRLYLTLFLLTAGVLIYGVCPTLGPGPSGTITLTVGFGGNAPPTGYALHAMLSWLIQSVLPFGEMAWKLNLLSALTCAISILALTKAALCLGQLLIPRNKYFKRSDVVVAWSLIFSAILYSEAIARITYFGDRYAISAMIISLILLNLAVFENRVYLKTIDTERSNWHILWATGLGALTFNTHFTMIPFGFTTALYLIFRVYSIHRMTPWGKVIIGAILGLLPVLYLPFNAAKDPLYNWGNPVNLKNLWYYLSRGEYHKLQVLRSWTEFYHDTIEFGELFWIQFSLFHLLLLGLLLIILGFRHKKIFLLTMIGLFLSGFLTRIVWYFPGSSTDPLYQELSLELIVKYFTPIYFLGALLIGIAGIYLLRWGQEHLPKPWPQLNILSIILVCSIIGAVGFKANNQKSNLISQELASNIEILSEQGDVIFTDFDTCFSALSYAQLENNQLLNRKIIHTSLLYRSWYIRTLEKLYPAFYARHTKKFTDLAKAITAIEIGETKDSAKATTIRKQLLIDIASNQSKNAIFTCPEAFYGEVQSWRNVGFLVEPYIFISRIHKTSHGLTKLPLANLSFQSLYKQNQRGDAWSAGILRRAVSNLEARTKIFKILEPKWADSLYEKSQTINKKLLKRPPRS